MSNTALTVPGKWSSFNSSTVHHLRTRHASFKSPRSEVSKSSIILDLIDEGTGENEREQRMISGDKLNLKQDRGDQISGAKEVRTNNALLKRRKSAGNESDVKQRRSLKQNLASGIEPKLSEISDMLIVYEAKIKTLETEKKQMTKQISALYNENKSLRMSANFTDQSGIDSYRQILEDRKLLRQAEDHYKERIAKLERVGKETLRDLQNLTEENRKLKEKTPRLSEQYENKSKYNELYWKWNALRKENEKLKKEMDVLIKFGSTSNGQILMGRGGSLDFLAAVKTKERAENQIQYKNVNEERNALKVENRKLRRENEVLMNQIKSFGEETDPRINDETVARADYQKLYFNSDKKAELYKRIMQLEHENTYLSVSNANLLREVHDLKTKYNIL